MTDFESLKIESGMAYRHTAYSIDKVDIYETTFHPNGECGCISLFDEYMFGIRCNHLMWAEGWLEDEDQSDAILIYGNHKGEVVTKLIVFDR
jgi:hypothetical protein